MLIFKKENWKSWVKNDFKTRCTEWCNFIKYKQCTPTFQENDATLPTYLSGPMDTQKVKVQFSSWPQITRWSVHKYIHNVTKIMCALYVRCVLSVLRKECRKVWGARYMLGAHYQSENTVSSSISPLISLYFPLILVKQFVGFWAVCKTLTFSSFLGTVKASAITEFIHMAFPI